MPPVEFNNVRFLGVFGRQLTGIHGSGATVNSLALPPLEEAIPLPS
jgi:hypothetical protein